MLNVKCKHTYIHIREHISICTYLGLCIVNYNNRITNSTSHTFSMLSINFYKQSSLYSSMSNSKKYKQRIKKKK